MPDSPKTPHSQKYTLPRDIDAALGGLTDDELLKISRAANAECKRRGIGTETPANPPALAKEDATATPTLSLPPAPLNAIRAAIQAGVKPAVVARQFGVGPAAIKAAMARN
jgi:hypothetical protein